MADRRYSLVNHTHDLDELVGSDNVALLDESNVFLGNVAFSGDFTLNGVNNFISNTRPSLIFQETDAGTDAKRWELVASADTFRLNLLTDAGVFSESPIVVTRTGAEATALVIDANTTALRGNWNFEGGVIINNDASGHNFIRGGGQNSDDFALIFGNNYDTSVNPIIRGFGGTAAGSAKLLQFNVPATGHFEFNTGRVDIIQATGGVTTDYLRLRDTTSTNDLYLRYNGAGAWVFNSESGGGGTEFLRFATSGAALFPNGSSSLPGITFTSDSNTGFRWSSSGTMFVVSDAFDLAAFAPSGLHMFNPIYIAERSVPQSDVAGRGQLWVKNTTPCQLWFTDDAGTDHQIV